MENTKKKKIKLIILSFLLLILSGLGIFISIRLYKLRQKPVAPTTPEKSEAAPSGTILESQKLKVTVVDTGPGNYESHTYFKPGGQTDARPVTGGVLTQKYTITNKTNQNLTLRLLAFPYKMYTIGLPVGKCTDLYYPEDINEFIRTQGGGNLEEAYRKFTQIFYEGVQSEWSGPQNIELPANGVPSAGSSFRVEKTRTIWESMWIGNKNYKRSGIIVDSTSRGDEQVDIKWSEWKEINTSNYPGTGDVIAEAIFEFNSTIYEEIWRETNNITKAYRRVMPINTPDVPWEGNKFRWEEIDISKYPGNGRFQSLHQYVTFNQNQPHIGQVFWRNNNGYSRQIPIENGAPKWDSDTTWKGPAELSSLPGEGDIQGQVDGYIVGNWYYTSIWRGGKEYRRRAIVHNGKIFWNANHCFDNPAVPPHDPSGGQERLATEKGAGALSCNYYKEKNIKTCTDSQTLVSYGNNPPYFTSQETITLGPGETKTATFSIINNICGFYQWDHGILVNNSEVFWTGTEIKFFPCETSEDACTPLYFDLEQATPSPTPTPEEETPTPRPSPTPTPEEETPTPRPRSTATSTPRPTFIPTPTPEDEPLPDAGISTPTMMGMTISILLIIISLALIL